MANKRIEKLTTRILKECNIDKLPIPVHKIAESRGLEVKPYDLGEGISGLLVIENGTGTIGFNPNESTVRQRFTIAHELGHYEMHKERNELFVDKDFKILYRDGNSSTGEHVKELEANAFAASLLMPEEFIRKEIEESSFDLSEEESLRKLARTFNVSVSAMTFRISNLGIFS